MSGPRYGYFGLGWGWAWALAAAASSLWTAAAIMGLLSLALTAAVLVAELRSAA